MKPEDTGKRGTREIGLAECVTLNNGVKMPWLGLGVFEIDNAGEAEKAVRLAIEKGYRHIDTAALYGNERAVGKAIRECGVDREALFVTSKVWNTDMREDRVERAFEESMERLGLDYVDLYLLHWPIEGKLQQSWAVLERYHKERRIRAIGVSNFLMRHIEELLSSARTIPAVNQIEYHPYLQSRGLRAYCDDKQIQLVAWSPFMHGGEILRDGTISEVANAHGKTVAQVILRWILQTRVATIPKTVSEQRMIENSDVFDFSLSDEEMTRISQLERGQRSGADPDNFDF